MDEQTGHSSGVPVTIVVAVAIVAALAGFGVTKAMEGKDGDKAATATPMAMEMESVSPTSATKAGDLRASLVTLGVEHMQLTDQAVASALDGNKDAADVKAALIKNGESISGAIGSVYGTEAQAAFQKLWNVHLTDFVNYAVAGSKGDAAGKAAALADIDANYTKPIAALLSGANPNLPKATLETAFGDHVSMTAGIIDDHVAGNYAKEMSDLAMANTHISGLMSTLAGAIVTQYPAKF